MKSEYKINTIHFTFFILFLLTTLSAKAKNIDTAIIYYRYSGNGYLKVERAEECDFIRMFTSPDPGQTNYNVKDFYKDGKIKFEGKVSQSLTTNTGALALDGDCVSYFSNGNKQDAAHYKDGLKDGNEYFFYPNGKIYSLKKNTAVKGTYNEKPLAIECYDTNGTMICAGGNGKWIIYDSEFKNIVEEGPVKKGYMDGEWHGSTIVNSDSIKYVFKYKNGLIFASNSYDKSGKEYPFKSEIEPAAYWSGPFNFLRALQGNLVLPKDENGKKMSADNIIVTFVVEKDGHIDKLQIPEVVDSRLKEAIAAAFSKCKNWTPRKNYGIPVRSKITLGLKYATSTTDRAFKDEIFYGEEQLNN